MNLNEYVALVRESMLPYQWEALNDRIEGAEKSYSMQNLKAASRIHPGKPEDYHGAMWQDSDLYKWLEAVGSALGSKWDDKLYHDGREGIECILEAQQEDGYLNSYFTVRAPEYRFDNVEQGHELYCAGHMIEAAVAWHQGTGETDFLQAACRLADCINENFGPEEGKRHGYPGHEELELALMRLYRETGEERYMRLAQYFINARGEKPNFFLEQRNARGMRCDWPEWMEMNYFQAHMPVRKQQHATGHAVRAVYLYTAMADVAHYTDDEELAEACQRLWKDIAEKQMYINGSVGSSPTWESFTVPYHLPLDRAYAETCAAIGLIFFTRRMIDLFPGDARYGDVMERILYNGVLSSFSRDGRHFFYTNPQQVYSDVSGCPRGQGDPVLAHEKRERQRWYGCACCPPNAARLMMSLSTYETSYDNGTLRLQLIIPGARKAKGEFGQIEWNCETSYPWDERIHITIDQADLKTETELAIRIPAWARENASFNVPAGAKAVMEGGFLRISHAWQAGDVIELVWPMPVRAVYANARVRDAVGRIAIMRGPLVYCVEQIDVSAPIHALFISRQEIEKMQPEWIEDRVRLVGACEALCMDEEPLYGETEHKRERTELIAEPYCLWGNRGETDMTIWLHESH